MAASLPTIGKAQIKLLEKLCNASAVSGDEGAVRKIVINEVEPYADELKVDAMGNVLVKKKGLGAKRLRVMLDAHMDEVGFMLVSDEGEGLFGFQPVGGIDSRVCIGKFVQVGNNHTPGVIGVKPIHLTSADERKRNPSFDSLRIDLGPNGNANLGDWVTFATEFRQVGPSLFAKAIDDRIGVATLIQLVKHAPENIDLLAAFTVQEELGLRGAKPAAYAFNPDLGIAIESTPAYDFPKHDGSESSYYNTKLGHGPAIYVYNSSAIDARILVEYLKETAINEGIPYQIRQPGGGGTDAGAIQRTRAGVPVISISVPGRYPHTPIGLCRVEDWKNTLKLIYVALKNMKPNLLREN